jgi:hypothetical protein
MTIIVVITKAIIDLQILITHPFHPNQHRIGQQITIEQIRRDSSNETITIIIKIITETITTIIIIIKITITTTIVIVIPMSVDVVVVAEAVVTTQKTSVGGQAVAPRQQTKTTTTTSTNDQQPYFSTIKAQIRKENEGTPPRNHQNGADLLEIKSI